MAVCAHADDVEIQCGGTLARYIAAGYKGYYVQVTNSNSGYHCLTPETGFDYSEKISALRREEARNAARVYGAEPVFLDFKEHVYTTQEGKTLYADIRQFPELGGRNPSGREPIVVACRMEKYINELADLMVSIEPEIVLTHEPCTNPDHDCTRLLVLRAFQEAGRRVKLGGLYMRVRSAWAYLKEPDFFVDVTSCADIVARAINQHVTQCKCQDRVPGLQRCWQSYAHRVAFAKYVEAFIKIA